MSLKDWISQRDKDSKPAEADAKRTVPDGIWEQCPGCKETLFIKELERNLKVCPKCQHHFPMTAPERIFLLADKDSFVESDAHLSSQDPLNFIALKSYKKTFTEAVIKTSLEEAVITGHASIDGFPVALAVMDFSFIGGSMGSVVGEKITRLIEDAEGKRLPLVITTCSGGARMHEGMLSLMQMAKTSAAIERYRRTYLPYICVMTHPTTGGVTASFASLADIIIAEPGATIGFTGARVIEDTMKQKLPRGFQTSEFMMEHGMVDIIVSREDLKEKIASLLFYLLKTA